jgi:hypothetical protein
MILVDIDIEIVWLVAYKHDRLRITYQENTWEWDFEYLKENRLL